MRIPKDKREKHHKNGTPYRNNSMAHIRARQIAVPLALFFASLPSSLTSRLFHCLSLSLSRSLVFPRVLRTLACKGKGKDVADTVAVALSCCPQVLKDVELAEAESASTTTEPEPLRSKKQGNDAIGWNSVCSCVDDAKCASFC